MPVHSRRVTEVVELARSALATHELGDLPFGYRQLVWASLGPRFDPPQCSDETALRRRFRLAQFSVEHALPTWAAIWPQDSTPTRVLESAVQVLEGTFARPPASAYLGEIWTALDDRAYSNDDEHQIELGAGYAALVALRCAIRDELFQDQNVDLTLTDGQVDADDLDAGYFAAAVAAHGTIWENTSDSRARRSFWEEWLRQVLLVASTP